MRVAGLLVVIAACSFDGSGTRGGSDDAPVAAGPSFVQHEAERAQQLSDSELDELAAEEPPAPAPSAPSAEPAPPPAKPGRPQIEDVCLDAACSRWAMDGFYDALARAKAKSGLARISLWGDSVTAEGYIAAGLRSRMGRTTGYGGAGFVFLAAPSRWYQNTAVQQSQSKGWVVKSIIRNSAPDGLHGYGGAAFVGTPGDSVTFATPPKGAGTRVARADVYYLASPTGGTFEIRVDGTVVRTVDTHADAARSGFAEVTMPDGAHTIDVRVTGGEVRAYGVTMERGSGVVVDSLGLVSNTAKNLGEIDHAHWQEQLAHRDADLLTVLLGANESAWMSTKGALAQYRKSWDKLLRRLRKGNPRAACLVIGTLDGGDLEEGKRFVGRAAIDGMIETQRAAAKAAGCAFWDARAFMGGKDSARTWYKKGLMSGDFEHLTAKGGRVLGSGIVEALEAGYARRKAR
jgi:lysophospholipase L1-like esterase